MAVPYEHINTARSRRKISTKGARKALRAKSEHEAPAPKTPPVLDEAIIRERVETHHELIERLRIDRRITEKECYFLTEAVSAFGALRIATLKWIPRQ